MTAWSAMPGHDPLYTGRAAHWLRRNLYDFLGVTFVVDDDLSRPLAVDPSERTIWARPGMPFPDLHRIVGRAALACDHPEEVPELRPPAPRLAAHNGILLPEHWPNGRR